MTRTIPAGTYNVYAGLSSGTGGDRIFGNLADVTGGTTNILGAFNQTFAATGGGTWGNSNLVPLKDKASTNTVVALSLSGTRTLRYNDGSGDFEFLLFTPVGAPAGPVFGKLTVGGGNLTITWTGGGSLQSSTDLKAWADVPNSSGGTFTTPLSGAHTFYRVKM